MKINILISTISILLIAVFNSFSQNTYVPDDNFELALIKLGYDSGPLNDSVPTANIKSIKKLLIAGSYIENLTGIEDFKELEILDCSSNYLKTLNISSNLALKELSCENTWISVLDIKSNPNLISLNCNSNRLTTLDVKSNPFLTKLNCAMNLLTSLDLSHCKELDSLDCSSNTLTSLDIQQNIQLTYLNCQQNQISSLNTSLNKEIGTLNCQFNQLKNLDVTNNIVLENLNCSYSPLNSLNVSQNILLKILICTNSSLTELDMSNNHEIKTLRCSSNKIKTLDLSSNPNLNRLNCANNQLTKLDLRNGNNEKMGDEFSGNMNATGNLNLLSIEVDNKYAAAAYSSWTKDNWAHYSSPGVEFSNQKTYIPDDNFEQALINLGFDSGELNDSVLTEAIKYIKTLNISYINIADLTGIKDFVSLERLYCEFNKLVDLDLSSNSKLIELGCAGNKLTGLNLQNGNNSNLKLNARENPDLLCIQVDDEASSYENPYWEKDLFTAYAEDCSNYKFEMTFVPDDNFEQAFIDLGLDNETTLNDSVPTIAIKYLKSLDIRYKNINDLTGIEDFKALQYLNCSGNQLTSLNLSANTALQELICKYNLLTEIKLGNNLSLTHIECNTNQLTNIDLIGINNLQRLFCYDNNIIDLDLSENEKLTYLNATNNQLTGVNLRNGNNSILLNIDLTSNQNLYCIQVDDPVSAIEFGDWLKSAYAIYSEDCSTFVLEMTFIPDDNFEQDLINQNFDFGPLNDSVPSAAIRALKYLNIEAREIHDLTGIEDFTSLETLICSVNFISAIDLSSNTNLKSLQCGNYLMEHLDVKNNTKLETLNCAGSSLTTLDLSSNPVLHTLNCGSNKLQNLDLSANPLLKNLACGNNYLQDLDLTSNKLLERINCTENLLNTINIQNGNNQNIAHFESYRNQPACILVDNIDSAYSHPYWLKDVYSDYSMDCSNHIVEMTYVPDDGFEQFFIDGKYDISLNDSVPTGIIKTFEELGIAYRNIVDLTGIQDFTSLSRLSCEHNQLSSLDLSNNTKIEFLMCNNNQLTSLNIGANNVLYDLNFNNNYLTNIDLSKCKNLLWLSCENNKLTSLDLSSNKAITELWAKNNALLRLNIQNGNNINFRVDARNNPDLTCIQVDDDNKAPDYFFWYKDKGASYSENCDLFGMTFIPDDNFEQAMIDLKYDEGMLDDYINSSKIAVIADLNLNSRNIKNLKGLEDFFGLKSLDCGNNNLLFTELERIQDYRNFINYYPNFIYWPQAKIGERIDTVVNINESITLDFPGYNAASRDFFRWKKNGTFLENSNEPQFTIENVTLADSGSYVLTIGNSFFPKLTLESEVYHLKVHVPVKNKDISLPDITIYPNPTNNRIFINLNTQTADLKIFNIAGIKVFEAKGFATSWLDLTDYLPGIYVFRFEIENTGVLNKKVIVE
jgi:Leucine-rich repeat (LRR) protein